MVNIERLFGFPWKNRRWLSRERDISIQQEYDLNVLKNSKRSLIRENTELLIKPLKIQFFAHLQRRKYRNKDFEIGLANCRSFPDVK